MRKVQFQAKNLFNEQRLVFQQNLEDAPPPIEAQQKAPEATEIAKNQTNQLGMNQDVTSQRQSEIMEAQEDENVKKLQGFLEGFEKHTTLDNFASNVDSLKVTLDEILKANSVTLSRYLNEKRKLINNNRIKLIIGFISDVIFF